MGHDQRRDGKGKGWKSHGGGLLGGQAVQNHVKVPSITFDTHTPQIFKIVANNNILHIYFVCISFCTPDGLPSLPVVLFLDDLVIV